MSKRTPFMTIWSPVADANLFKGTYPGITRAVYTERIPLEIPSPIATSIIKKNP